MVYPEQYEQPQYEPQKSPTEVIISNIIRAVVCIFLLVLGFFIVIMIVAMLNTQTAVQFVNYTDDFAISNPLMNNVIYTSNPHLSSIVVSKYNSSNATFGGVPDIDWSFDADTTALEITGGLEWTITSVRVDADTTYSETPALSVLSAWALALIILSIASIFGIVAYSRYNSNRSPYR